MYLIIQQAVVVAPCATKEGKHQCASIFHVSDCLTFAIIPLAKASHMIKFRVSVRGDCPGTWVQGSHKQTGGYYYNNLPHILDPR